MRVAAEGDVRQGRIAGTVVHPAAIRGRVVAESNVREGRFAVRAGSVGHLTAGYGCLVALNCADSQRRFVAGFGCRVAA